MSENLVIKIDGWPGVDQAIIDFRIAPIQVKITTKIFKIGRKAYIGLDQYVRTGEIFVAGTLGFQYRVTQDVPIIPDGVNTAYPIKRVDGANITSTDINSIVVGKYAKIFGRKSYQQQLDQVIKATKK
ncbi:hypothetical protein EBU94_04710 [bacterium]|nr:hypothetical protein [bacterium]